MQLPPRIRIRAVDSAGHPVPGLVFSMLMTTGQRNPYVIVLPMTDSGGHAEMGADDVQGQFYDCIESDLMGHFGNLADASQQVVFSLFDVEQLRRNRLLALQWPLLPHEATRWASREQKTEHLLSARNAGYEFPDARVNLEASGSVELKVKRRDEA